MAQLCQMTVGFLIPRPCENKAAFACTKCGRQVCSEHAVVLDSGIVCEACHLGFDSAVAPGTLAARTAQYGAVDMIPFLVSDTETAAGADAFSDLS